MFCAFVGDAGNVPAWRKSVEHHAGWLGLAFHNESRPLAQGGCFAFGWLMPPSAAKPGFVEAGGNLRLQTSAAAPASQAADSALADPDDNLVRVGVALPAGQVRVWVPAGTPEPFYFARDRRGWMLGNDLRLIVRWLSAEPDERGLYALFQYGAIPAPLTIARGVCRVPNGHVLLVQTGLAQADLQRFFFVHQSNPESEEDETRDLDPASRVSRVLDGLLCRVEPSALYFSGGVDSSLLAARLLALGFSGVHLINFSFGPDDPEGQHARRVAAHLGLRYEQIMYRPEDVVPMLQRIGRDYSFPFLDISVIPTNLLVRASLDFINGSHVVLEGTGADSAFGTWTPHSRVAHLPRPARWALAAGYDWLRLWQQPSELERVARLARGSLQMPRALALVIAQNVLDQIAYRMPKCTRRELETALAEHVETVGAGLEVEQQFSLLDLIHDCAGMAAAKSFDPLRSAGIRPVYPFLEPPMLRLSASLCYAEKSTPGQSKAVLRSLLRHHLPDDLIERPKSGFLPPVQAILAQPKVQEYVHDTVLAASNPVLSYCHVSVLKQMLARAAKNLPLAAGAYRFLWVVVFASCWLEQIER